MKKDINNIELSSLLNSLAAALKIKDEKKNRFRIIAYERAATAIEHLSSEAKDLWDEGRLEEVSGIGKSIAENIGEIFEKGKSKHFQEILNGIPRSVFELIKIPGIGPKRAYQIATELKISEENPIKDLKKALDAGIVSELEGFGEELTESLKKGLKEAKGREKRLRINYAQTRAEEIINWMKQSKDVEKVDTLGSLRRKVSTIGDIDLSAAAKNPQNVIEHFIQFPKKIRTLERGEKSAAILLPGNIQVDLKVMSPDEYGSLLQHFTGSKHHNVKLREYALKKKMSLSEYGIKIDGKTKKYSSEEDFYKALGMVWIPPELREDTGEIEASMREAKGEIPGLPNLVKLKDIKADLHIHSNFDIETSHDLGQSSMEEVIKVANGLGYEYIAFTEHNPSKSKHNNKEINDLIKRKKEKIEQINESIVKKVKKSPSDGVQKVFNSLEIDMLSGGGLPVDDKGLEHLDFALVSIHSSFDKPRREMTKRVIKSLEHPKAKIFAHPTGRILGEREGVELDWEEIFDFALKNNKWLEINCDPARLDLPDFLVQEAIQAGVKLTLGTDTHHISSMGNMQYGVWVARRGWAEAKDIVNTRSYQEFEKLLK